MRSVYQRPFQDFVGGVQDRLRAIRIDFVLRSRTCAKQRQSHNCNQPLHIPSLPVARTSSSGSASRYPAHSIEHLLPRKPQLTLPPLFYFSRTSRCRALSAASVCGKRVVRSSRVFLAAALSPDRDLRARQIEHGVGHLGAVRPGRNERLLRVRRSAEVAQIEPRVAHPVLCVGGQLIARIALHESFEGGDRALIVSAPVEGKRIVVGSSRGRGIGGRGRCGRATLGGTGGEGSGTAAVAAVAAGGGAADGDAAGAAAACSARLVCAPRSESCCSSFLTRASSSVADFCAASPRPRFAAGACRDPGTCRVGGAGRCPGSC